MDLLKSLRSNVHNSSPFQLSPPSIATPDPPSKCHRNRHKPVTVLEKPPNFSTVILDNNSPINNNLINQPLSLTLSHQPNNQTQQQFCFSTHFFPMPTNIWLPKSNQIFDQMPYFPLNLPSFHLVFCFKTTPLYSPSRDSCVAMKHTTCQQQRSKVYSSVLNFSLWTATQQKQTTNQKSLLPTLKNARYCPTISSRHHKQTAPETDAWNALISTLYPKASLKSKAVNKEASRLLFNARQPTNKLHTEA